LIKLILGLFYGLVYGIAHVIPGLSGGTFLVIFGCYDTVCEAFALNFKEIKKHFFFLLMIGIGTIGGLVGFVYAISFLFDNFGVQTSLFFMGLIFGGLPLIFNIATSEQRFKPICAIPFILGLALVVGLFLIEKSGAFENDITQTVDLGFALRIVIYMFIAAIAMVMPGISGALVLVAFGVYGTLIEAVKTIDLTVLAPATIGAIIGIVVGARLVLFLLKRFKLMVYSAIIGMVIGSAAPVFPQGAGLNAATLIGVFCFAAGFMAAFLLGKNEMKKKKE